jgi:hypothetical protein
MKPEETIPAGGAAQPRRLVRRCLFLFGAVSLSFVLGAAVMFFELPLSTFLRRAFVGGAAWYEAQRAGPQPTGPLPQPTVGKVDRPDRTCDGFTLLMYGGNSRALLVNMRGDVVHSWHVPFSKLEPDPAVRGRIDDAAVYFNDGHLFPNGDLLVVVVGARDLRGGLCSPG